MVSADDMNLRREIVQTLHAKGLPSSEIVKRIQADPLFSHLLEGYHMPLYRVVQNDVKWYRRTREVLADEAKKKEGLLEYCERMDGIFREAWEQLEGIEILTPKDVETLLNLASKAASSKAKALGIDPETGTGEGARSGVGHIGDNIMFADPEQFMKFMGQVDQARRLQEPAPKEEDNTVEGEVVEVGQGA
ncbi:hypothetical protein LCGC14_0577470 [marine sediment metagenome]|uniref:Uncharacterized protein n=1 Tax=marine sediment metagenome TaxID=412755 RepID=A0A0F9RME5_9ZZZZ